MQATMPISVAVLVVSVPFSLALHVAENRPASPGDVRLPELSTMNTGSSEALKNINSQTILFETRVAQKQAENQAKLTKLKAELEAKLDAQQKDNKNKVFMVTNLSAKTRVVEADLSNLEKRVLELKRGNDQRRGDLKLLQQKLATARAFAESSLNATDDSAAKELVVFNTPPPSKKPQGDVLAALGDYKSVEEAMEFITHGQEQDDAIVQGMSLLAVSAHVKKIDSMPHDLLALLQQGLDQIVLEEQRSEQTLQAAFTQQSTLLAKEEAGLTLQRTALERKLASLLSLQAKWKEAEVHLGSTRTQLDQRLQGLHLFLDRLSADKSPK